MRGESGVVHARLRPGELGINRRYEPRQDEASISVDAIQRKRIRVSRALTPRARAGDTEEVDCQRAEAHLRLLAEEELRRPAWPGGAPGPVGRVAELLIAMGALDDEVADRIVADFDLALAARQAVPEPAVLAARLQRRSAAVRFRPAMPVTPCRPGPARCRAGWSGWGR